MSKSTFHAIYLTLTAVGVVLMVLNTFVTQSALFNSLLTAGFAMLIGTQLPKWLIR